MNSPLPQIQYRSKPANVSMADDWYEIASLNHFWIKHRFKIFDIILRKIRWQKPTPNVADIGCGCGLLQRQLGTKYGWKVDGYDLNQAALSKSIAFDHSVVFYDINERHDDLKMKYDVIFLFDVIEHLEDEAAFLESVKFHLKSDGIIVVNVPAEQWLFSRYDEVAGHYRRYTRKSLNRIINQAGLSTIICTYWGLAYIPLILARKIVLSLNWRLTDYDIINSGFKPPSEILNKLLTSIIRFDPFPNFFAGSSLMGVYRLEDNHE
ncbi:MAG: class I SAM-dependent methyltransferase [Cyanobacteriota bacterium]|jgi:2-polyprenyl-3-methyl-5-hydroxy-6-metoxy-1,4-benzoquinol methylase